MAITGLTLEALRADQYRQVAEWAWGPQENADWDDYAAQLNEPQRINFGIYLGAELVGCLFLERVDRNTVESHVATARKKIHPKDLANVLLNTAADLFTMGYTAMVARIPRRTRAAARLALRCGMFEWGHTPTTRYFILTESRYKKYASSKT